MSGRPRSRDDQIRTMGRDHGQRLRSVAGLQGLVAVGIEHGGDEVGDALFILKN
jgi:hypothetical protein